MQQMMGWVKIMKLHGAVIGHTLVCMDPPLWTLMMGHNNLSFGLLGVDA